MDDTKGFDDLFDKAFGVSYANTKTRRPKGWPKSTSEMRKHVSFAGQGGLSDGNEYYNYRVRTQKAIQGKKAKMANPGYVLPSKVQLIACEACPQAGAVCQNPNPKMYAAIDAARPEPMEVLQARRNLRFEQRKAAAYTARGGKASPSPPRTPHVAKKKQSEPKLLDGRQWSWDGSSSA